MSGNAEDAKAMRQETPEDAAVVEYLRRHPEFLIENPDVVATLTPPEFHHGDGVVDMQKFMLDGLRKRIAAVESRERKLMAMAEERVASYGRVQDAAVALLAAQSFRHLVRVVNAELPGMLDVKSARLCLESDGSAALPDGGGGVTLIEPGILGRIMGRGRDAVLIEDAGDRAGLVGMAEADVRSLALARLSCGRGNSGGALALGSASADGFHPRQGTDLLSFLARVLEHCVRRWLNAPA